MHSAFNSANFVGWALTSWREMRWCPALPPGTRAEWGESYGVSTEENFCSADLLSEEARLPI